MPKGPELLDAFQARVVKYVVRGEGHRMLVDLLLIGEVTE